MAIAQWILSVKQVEEEHFHNIMSGFNRSETKHSLAKTFTRPGERATQAFTRALANYFDLEE